MKRNVCTAFCIVLFFAIVASSVLPSFASGASLTETEAKQIILNAFKFYYKYQFSETAITLNRDDISAEAKGIYSDDVADDMWMKRCYGSKDRELYKNLCYSLKKLKTGEQETAPGLFGKASGYYQNQIDLLFGNDGQTFVDNGNGTVTIQPFASEIMDWRKFRDSYYGVNVDSQYKFWQVVISKEYSSDFFSEKIRPSVPGDIEIRSLSTNGGKASCDVLIYADVEPEPSAGGVNRYRPVWASVEFSLTDGQWRICGGDILPALSDWSVIEGKTLPSDVTFQHRNVFCQASDFESGVAISRSNHLLDVIPRTLIEPYYLNSIKVDLTDAADIWYRYGNYLATNAGQFRFISQSGNKAVYEVECISWTDEFGENYIGEINQFYRVYINSYGTHTAEFTYDPDYTYTYVHVPGDQLVGAWRLTGGEWYDILTGRTELESSPVTADESLLRAYALLASAALSAALFIAAVVVRRRKA